MKTVSTKLENRMHDKFLELCNEDGKCQSEFLRDLIETLCEDCSENKEASSKDLEPEIVTNEIKMAHGEIFDDNGNLIGTF